MVLYQLPKLSYDYDELEPFIDRETMQIHHSKHHQTYVDGLNASLAEIGAASHPKYISAILSELNSIPESGRSAINFFGGGFENHRLFWETLTPNGDKSPGGQLEDQIDVYFDDCTGYCVADGTAENPISSSDCLSPNEPYIGSMELNESSATFEMVMGEGGDSYCEKWNLTRID